MLVCVFLGRHFAVDPSTDGSYFIDRSSKWFRCILDYLRNYQLSVDMSALSQTERSELRAELEFYGLASALELFGTRLSMRNLMCCLFVIIYWF